MLKPHFILDIRYLRVYLIFYKNAFVSKYKKLNCIIQNTRYPHYVAQLWLYFPNDVNWTDPLERFTYRNHPQTAIHATLCIVFYL